MENKIAKIKAALIREGMDDKSIDEVIKSFNEAIEATKRSLEEENKAELDAAIQEWMNENKIKIEDSIIVRQAMDLIESVAEVTGKSPLINPLSETVNDLTIKLAEAEKKNYMLSVGYDLTEEEREELLEAVKDSTNLTPSQFKKKVDEAIATISEKCKDDDGDEDDKKEKKDKKAKDKDGDDEKYEEEVTLRKKNALLSKGASLDEDDKKALIEYAKKIKNYGVEFFEESIKNFDPDSVEDEDVKEDDELTALKKKNILLSISANLNEVRRVKLVKFAESIMTEDVDKFEDELKKFVSRLPEVSDDEIVEDFDDILGDERVIVKEDKMTGPNAHYAKFMAEEF
jgi:hypothetical protein